MIKGIAFDMDGTLTKPAIDFNEIRGRIAGLKPNIPIYEQVLEMKEPEKTMALSILDSAERESALKAEPNPGLYALMDYLERKNIRNAIFTRNSRSSLELTLTVLGLDVKFEPIITRESALKLKPDPEQIIYILNSWKFRAEEVLVVGDFPFDVIAGKRAGSRTALLNHNLSYQSGASLVPEGIPEQIKKPDYLISDLSELINIIERIND